MSKSGLRKERTLNAADCVTVYEYPRSMLGRNYAGLSSSILVNRDFVSPLQRLLAELKKNGSDVEACQIELKALRKSLKAWEKFANQTTAELLHLRFKPKP